MRLILLFAVVAANVYAQSTEAAISGIVTDPHGAFMPNVAVTAVRTDTGAKTLVRSNESGFYSIGPLPIGTYTLSAEARDSAASVNKASSSPPDRRSK